MVYVVAGNKVEDNWKPTLKAEEKNIHDSLKFFLVISQILGMLPQENITKSHSELSFKWRSWRVIYTLSMIVVTSFAVLICFLNWFFVGYDFADVAVHFFYSTTAMTLILYLRLARSWPKLMKSWCRVDKIMNANYGYPKGLDIRLRIISVIALVLGLSYYFLSVWSRYDTLTTSLGKNYSSREFFVRTFHQLFNFLPFNVLTAGYCSLMTVHASLVWAFNDLFIIIMSTALAMRFKQVARDIVNNFNRAKPEQFWADIREDYDRLSILCKELDDQISYIVLLSYTQNIFFLLVQVYSSLKVVSGTVEKVYFIFSFLYLIVKLGSVSLYGAWINDESVEPAHFLNSVSSASYNVEIKRLLIQIHFDNVALTGCRMFKMTRGLILSIAGAVVTYELVLIQFNSATNFK